MIPFKDNLRYLSFAWVSIFIFSINVLVYIGELTLMASGNLDSTISTWLPVRQAAITAVTAGDPWLLLKAAVAMFAAMFMHSSFMHIFGNMCFFFTFAPALEARMGHVRFAIFYLVSGWMASIVFLLTDVSGTGHILGASGAIGGVLGAYLIYYPRARVDGWMPPLTPPTSVAAFFLADFFILQWVSIWHEMHAAASESAGVAFWAHVGGITFGMIVAAFILLFDVGLTRLRYKLYYLFAAAVTLGGFLAPVYTQLNHWAVFGTVALTALVGTRLFFPRPDKTWAEVVVTAATTMSIFSLLGFSVGQGVLVVVGSAGLAQVLGMTAVTMTLMILSIVVAVIARRFPRLGKPLVVVPKVPQQDRILAEVVFDLILGFFRFLENALAAGSGFVVRLIGSGLRSGTGLLYRGSCFAITMVLMAYRRVTPQVVQSGLAKASGKLLRGLSFIVRKLRLDRVGKVASFYLGRLYVRLA